MDGVKYMHDGRGKCWLECDKNKNDQKEGKEKIGYPSVPGCVKKENFYKELTAADIRAYFVLKQKGELIIEGIVLFLSKKLLIITNLISLNTA